jgi:hypothetical protein
LIQHLQLIGIGLQKLRRKHLATVL